MTVDQKSRPQNQTSLPAEDPGDAKMELRPVVDSAREDQTGVQEHTSIPEVNPTPRESASSMDTQAEPDARELTVESTAMTGVELPGAGEHGLEATMDAATFGEGGMQRSGSRGSRSASGSRSQGSPGHARRLEPGTRVGRYLVVECIGEGAMGQVYAAFDPELDRKVALKIMHVGSEEGSSKDSAPSSPARRLMREAKALSQLAHPNVVSVFDVGALGKEIFVAMEFVAGTDLRRWSKETPRSWREVLEVYLQAGQGLAAAHAAGLVHRDFKPHNAIVGEDGRVRVLDFGLATPRSAAHHAQAAAEILDKPIAGTTSHSGRNTDAWERLTQTGSVLGTPAYMAPEVIAGLGADEKSDQFSFAVSLFQALYGCLPFAGKTLREMADSIHSGRVAELHGHHVPGWLRKALLKGLHADPARRFPSLQDMLTVLMRQDPSSVRARWAARMGGAVAAIMVVGLGVASVMERNAQVCRGADRRLAGVWDTDRGKQVEASLLATGLTYAPDTWTRVKDGLDAYARGWVSMHTEACEATHVRGEQSGEMLDLRMRCLQVRLGEVKALVDVLSQADPEILSKAVPAVNSLVPLSLCMDAESLRTEVTPPRDPAVRQQVEALRERLEQVRALERTGKYADGMTAVEALETESRALGYPPLIAEVLLLKGILLSQRGKYQESTAVLLDADATAADVKHVQVSAWAKRELVYVAGYQLQRLDDGLVHAHHALAFLRQSGLFDRLGDRLLSAMGLVLLRKGELDKAIDQQKQALHLCSTHVPEEQCYLFTLRLAMAYYNSGRYQEAETAQLQAISASEKVLGPAHPDLGKAMNNFGPLLMEMGRYEEGVQWMQRARVIYEQAYDREHPLIADVINNIGNAHWWRMEYQEALHHHQQALDIRLKLFGAEHNTVANSLQNVAADNLGMGKLVLARQALTRALELKTRLLGAGHMQTLACLGDHGRLLLVENKLEQAEAELDKVIAQMDKSLGSTHPSLYEPLLTRAEVALARNDPETAKGLFQRSLDIQKINHVENRFTVQTHMGLAKALWAAPDTRNLAVEHAHRAAEILSRFTGAKTGLLRELDGWLAQHTVNPR